MSRAKMINVFETSVKLVDGKPKEAKVIIRGPDVEALDVEALAEHFGENGLDLANGIQKIIGDYLQKVKAE